MQLFKATSRENNREAVENKKSVRYIYMVTWYMYIVTRYMYMVRERIWKAILCHEEADLTERLSTKHIVCTGLKCCTHCPS